MLFRAISIGAGICISAWMYYLKSSRSRQVISTTEWVQLMRENDVRFDASRKREANKAQASKAKAKA
jgi:hypothetical protein